MSAREFDLTLLGATGFTGNLVLRYLSKHLPKGARLAIAGRNQARLEQAAQDVAPFSPALIIASTSEPDTLADMARRSRVVVSTVGPFAQHGPPVVAACVEAGTHFADITGEPAYVDEMIEQHHEVASDKRLKIISCCGFDSIPHDLGVLFTVEALRPVGAVEVRGYVSAKGEFSGGTWHSAVRGMGNYRRDQKIRRGRPRLPTVRKVRRLRDKIRYVDRIKGYAVPLPTIDPDVVLRSARVLDGYGETFAYGHFMRIGSAPKVGLVVASVGTMFALAQVGLTRNLLLKIKAQGDGPTPEVRAASKFRVVFVARDDGRTLVAQVSGGDPGYDETAKMLAESAMALAFDADKLPEHYGVVTPAVGMGRPLIDRLIAAGMKFEVLQE